MASIETRLATLEANFANEKETLEKELHDVHEELAEVKKKLAYYDRMALRWGSIAIGALTIGAFAAMGFEKAKDKIIGWVLQ